MTDRRLRPLDVAVAFAIAALYVVILVKTAHVQGYARDEGFYFSASERYASWFELLFREPMAALKRSAVDPAFAANAEHPVLAKSLFSLSWLFLFKKWHLFAEEGTSFRFPGMCFAGLTLAVLYLWGAEAKGRRVGLVAAALFALVPTTFYHAHLDCFDVPITAMWLLTAWCYWKSLKEGGLGWAIATGVVFGLTLDTKHNSWFLPFAVVAHVLVSRGPSLRRDWIAGRFRVPLALVSMATIGPMVFVATWPRLWFDTAKRFAEYVAFHTGHEYYNMEFLGTTYFQPPFPRSYAWLMSAATIPTVTLALFAVGLALIARDRLLPLVRGERAEHDPTSLELLWLIGVAVNYAPWLSRGTPIFGGTKHWLTAYPFVMLIAAVGFDEIVRRLVDMAPVAMAKLVPSLAAASVLAAPAVETFRVHPWGLSAYTPLVGGTPGAASLGLNRGFWGYQTGSLTAALNEKVPQGGTVYVHDTAMDSWSMLQRDGRLRKDIRGVMSPAYADAALYHHEQHMEGVEYQIWVAFGTTVPTAIEGLDGVPIVWLYTRKR
jgi:hypothetical protein